MNDCGNNGINSNLSNINSQFRSRLVIKNIPENFSTEQIQDVLTKNFDNVLKENIIIKLDHKHNLKKNKMCFITVENLETRKKVFDFFSSFELVDPKGFKQKLTVVDCLYQVRPKIIVKDQIENTLFQMDHFMKFKEYFSSEKLVDYKNEEEKFCTGLFEGVEDIQMTKEKKPEVKEKEKKPAKTIITKKQQNISETDLAKPQIIVASDNTQIEVITEASHFNNSSNGGKHYSKSGKYRNNNDHYYNSSSSDYYKNSNTSTNNNNAYYDNGNYYENDYGYGNQNYSSKGGYSSKKGYKKGYK